MFIAHQRDAERRVERADRAGKHNAPPCAADLHDVEAVFLGKGFHSCDVFPGSALRRFELLAREVRSVPDGAGVRRLLRRSPIRAGPVAQHHGYLDSLFWIRRAGGSRALQRGTITSGNRMLTRRHVILLFAASSFLAAQ